MSVELLAALSLFICGGGFVYGFYLCLDRDRTAYACLCFLCGGLAFIGAWWIVLVGFRL